jgi:hypothetical protein
MWETSMLTIVEVGRPGVPLMSSSADIVNFPLDTPKLRIRQCEGMFDDSGRLQSRSQHII